MAKKSVYLDQYYASEYDQDRFGGLFGKYLHDCEVETFLSMVNGSSGRILDVGAGTGKLSLSLMRRSHNVTSLDSSGEMLQAAKAKAESEGMNLKFVICDAHKLCFKENAFTCVVSSRVLMHLTDWKGGLSEFCRVAKCVMIDFPPLISFSGLHSIFRRGKSILNLVSQPYNAYLVSAIIQEFQKHNFDIVAIKRDYFLPIAFHRWLGHPRFSLLLEKMCKCIGLVRLLGSPVTVKAVKQDKEKTCKKNCHGN